ncbi:MAG: hypothetical protein WDZ77_00045 [Candidatus Pacearchaeota archaeon]
MAFNIEALIWYLLLIDSVFANIFSWCCSVSYKKKFKKLTKIFPASKGWALLYLVLVLWVGSALWRLGILGF